MRNKNKKVIVAMSGGLDSSAAAFLLQEQGYDVMGMFMRLGVVDQQNYEAAARRVCQKLNIKFYPINFAYQFKKEIIDYFLDSYAYGLTPNPCVKCNQIIKFGELLKRIKELGADYLATGHYSRNVERKMYNAKSVYELHRGKDSIKDQSYFLYNLTQKQLAHILFPLGDYTKEQIRKMVYKFELPCLSQESQDVCFLHGDHNNFLRENLSLKSGKIKILNGKVVGKHHGLPLYTIGQRKGVEIGGIGPFYVAYCDYKTNTLYVIKNKDDPALYGDNLAAKDVNWIAGKEPKMPLKCEAVIRYRHKQVKCVITKPLSDFNNHSVAVKFNKSQRAITSGQSAVFYQGDKILGGGIIKRK